MSYRIEYDGGTRTYEVTPGGRGGALLLAVVVMVLALAVSFSTEVRGWFIPGKDAVTVQAFRTMTDDLRSGATVMEAVETFCRIVVHEK